MTIHTVRDERDIQRYADFHGNNPKSVYGSYSREWCRVWGITAEYLLRYHPEISRDDFFFIEGENTKEIISTTCLIPWHCRYEDISLKVAMLELVATHPEYRGRGLIREQIKLFHRRVIERGFDLIVVWGIPNFYRQFGYGYALDLQSADALPVPAIPSMAKGERSKYTLHKPSLSDVHLLAKLYDSAMSSLQLYDVRSLEYWRFLLRRMKFPVQIVERNSDGKCIGYFCLQDLEDKAGIKVFEHAIFSSDAAMFVLQKLKAEYDGEIQLGWPVSSSLVSLGRSLGSKPLPPYQWFVRIPSVIDLLKKISPVLEGRLSQSHLTDFTAEVRLNLYHEAFLIEFQKGKIVNIKSIGFLDSSVGAEGGDINLPIDVFVRLVLGYRKLDDMRDAWPDIKVRPAFHPLLNVLFSRMSSYLNMPWQYYGPMGEKNGR
jgi:GNAT superfamily N-acetyltransferase